MASTSTNIEQGDTLEALECDAKPCREPCVACGCSCVKPYGHSGLHSTQHGNMKYAIFMADQEDINLGDRRYAHDETAKTETCDSFCCRVGRGHVHTILCVPEKCQNPLLKGHRHSEIQYKDGEGRTYEVDELTHDAYFQHIGFEDPCFPEQQREFKKCNAQCPLHSDEGDNPQKFYCTQKLWHEPLKQGDPFPGGLSKGYISKQGHLFPCEHHTFQTFFIIDKSKSMNAADALPTLPIFKNNDLLNNRLGAVFEAAIKYCKLRAHYSPEDTVSFVPFDDEATVAFSNISVSQEENIFKSMQKYFPKFGANFEAGFMAAFNALIAQVNQSYLQNIKIILRKPVFILLTDSRACRHQEYIDLLQRIMIHTIARKSGLCVHALSIGNNTDKKFLKQIAKIGKGSYCQIKSDNKVPLGVLVSDVFTSLAEKPDINVGLLTPNH